MVHSGKPGYWSAATTSALSGGKMNKEKALPDLKNLLKKFSNHVDLVSFHSTSY